MTLPKGQKSAVKTFRAEGTYEAKPNIFSYRVSKRGWVVKSDKPHPLLDLVQGLPGNSPGSLSAIKENTGYISGFSG